VGHRWEDQPGGRKDEKPLSNTSIGLYLGRMVVSTVERGFGGSKTIYNWAKWAIASHAKTEGARREQIGLVQNEKEHEGLEKKG